MITSLLNREEEVTLFAQIEEGRRIIQKAISQTNLEWNSSIYDLDNTVSRLEAIAEDISFLERLVSSISSGKKLIASQTRRLAQMIQSKSLDRNSDPDFRNQKLYQKKVGELARL